MISLHEGKDAAVSAVPTEDDMMKIRYHLPANRWYRDTFDKMIGIVLHSASMMNDEERIREDERQKIKEQLEDIQQIIILFDLSSVDKRREIIKLIDRVKNGTNE